MHEATTSNAHLSPAGIRTPSWPCPQHIPTRHVIREPDSVGNHLYLPQLTQEQAESLQAMQASHPRPPHPPAVILLRPLQAPAPT